MRQLFYIVFLFLIVSCSKDDELKSLSPGLDWTIDIGYDDDFYSLDRQGMALTTDNGFFVIENDVLKKYNNDGNFEFTSTQTADKIITTDNGFLTYHQATSTVTALNNDLSIDWEFSLNDVHYLLATNDGYLITHTSSPEVSITKLSLTGEVEWQKTIIEANANFNSIQKNVNGFIAIGQKTSTDVWKNVWIVHLDNSGEIIWENTYDKSGTNDEAGIDIYPLDNGNFLALTTSSTTTVDYDASSIMILDKNGELINENQFEHTYFKSIIPTNDGDFLAIGSGYLSNRRIPTFAPYSYNSNYESAIATKISQNGERIWQVEKFVSEYDNIAHSVIETKDNGFLVLADGESEYGDYYLEVFKINSED